VVFWAMTLCSDMTGYQLFGGLSYLHFQGEDVGSQVLRKVGTLSHHITTQRRRLESWSPW